MCFLRLNIQILFLANFECLFWLFFGIYYSQVNMWGFLSADWIKQAIKIDYCGQWEIFIK